MKKVSLTVCILAVFTTCAHAQVSQWRGDGAGVYPKATPVTRWNVDDGTNILWKTAVGKAYSSPVVGGGKVFVTSEMDGLAALDAKTGKLLWQAENDFKALGGDVEEKRHPSDCGYASPTPVTNGKSVWVSYGSGIVACFDVDGKRRWMRWLDKPPATEYGRSASPVLVDGKLVFSLGNLIALDPETGKTLWECEDAREAYGTPATAVIGGEKILVTPLGSCVRVADGKLLAEEIASCTYASPVVSGDVVVFFDGAGTYALKLSKKDNGKIGFEELWDADTQGECFASPVIHDGVLYGAVNEGGLFAIDMKTGETLYERRLPIASAGGGGEAAYIYPSLALAGNHIYLGNDAGEMLVFKPGREYQEVARNVLDDGSGACPAFDGNRIFLRAGKNLVCIGRKDKD